MRTVIQSFFWVQERLSSIYIIVFDGFQLLVLILSTYNTVKVVVGYQTSERNFGKQRSTTCIAHVVACPDRVTAVFG